MSFKFGGIKVSFKTTVLKPYNHTDKEASVL